MRIERTSTRRQPAFSWQPYGGILPLTLPRWPATQLYSS